MPFDLPPVSKLWLPPKPAIIRALRREDLLLASFLPGMFPAGAAAAEALTLTQVGSAVSEAATVTAPATVNPGDLLILWQRGTSLTPPTLVEPAGFTTISNQSFASGSGADSIGNFCYKIADGSEDGATLTGMDASSDRKTLYQFRGSRPIAAVNVGDLATTAADTNPGSQTVNASGGASPLIVMAGYSSTGAIDPRTFSPAKDGEISSGAGNTHWLAYKIYNTAPADVTVDMDDEGDSNYLHSFYIECS